MHYKNGREAKNGDKVMFLRPSAWDEKGIATAFTPTVGFLYDATPGNSHCNGRLAMPSSNDPMPDLSQCLHMDDVLQAIADSKACAQPAPEPAPTAPR